MSADLDCTRCGACCFSPNPHYVQILPQDEGRAISPLSVHEHEGRRFLNMNAACGHCALLGLSADGRLVCGDYDNRPEACRAFRAGSFECLKARQHRGALAMAKMNSIIPAATIEEPETPAGIRPI